MEPEIQFKPNILHYIVGFFDDKTPYIQYINRRGEATNAEECAHFMNPTNALKLASFMSTWKNNHGKKNFSVFSVYTNGKIRQLNEGVEKDGDYRVMINPWNKMWYVAMKVAPRKWTPVGPGFKDKIKAIKYMTKREKKMENIKHAVVESPHLDIGKKLSIDLRIERYPMSLGERVKLIRQLKTDEGITGFSNKLGKMLRFKMTGVTSEPKGGRNRPSHIQLPAYWEKYALWSRS